MNKSKCCLSDTASVVSFLLRSFSKSQSLCFPVTNIMNVEVFVLIFFIIVIGDHTSFARIVRRQPILNLDPNRCLEPKEMGGCRATLGYVYFDTETKTCKDFIWGGCDGNENRFRSTEDCEKVCAKWMLHQNQEVETFPVLTTSTQSSKYRSWKVRVNKNYLND